jgi:hypothetical protein
MHVNGSLVARLAGQRVVDASVTTWADGENVEHKLDELMQSQRC